MAAETVSASVKPELGGPSTASSLRSRAVSSETAAKISLTAPKFIPPKPEGEKEPELPDLREIDKPRNGILRLPKYVVREPKQPVLHERDLLTLAGKLDLAYKRHPGLRKFSLPFLSNNAIALEMLEDEHRLDRLSEMNELLSVLRAGGDPTAAKAKAQFEESFIRKTGWVDGGMYSGSWQQTHPYP